MTVLSVDVLDRLIRENEDRIHRLKAMRQIVVDDPTLVGTFMDEMFSPTANGKILSQPQGNFEGHPDVTKLINYLASRKPDDWARVSEMADATGVNKNNIYMHLGRTLKDRVEINHPSPKRKFWRLKKDDSARGGGSSA